MSTPQAQAPQQSISLPKPSALILAWGVAAIIIGPLLLAIGASSRGLGFLAIIGGIGTLAGLIQIVQGVYRLATHIDNLETERLARADWQRRQRKA